MEVENRKTNDVSSSSQNLQILSPDQNDELPEAAEPVWVF
jgi:hypothetical protein